jgi:RHS repeat-associated protein
MTSPVDGATLIAGRSTTLWATAGDADGAIASVEFFDGSTKLGNAGQQVGQPGVYGLTRSAGFTLGAHTLSVRATDDSGYVATATIQITAVTDPGTAPEASVPAIPDGTVLTAPTPIIGTASSPILASYHLEYRPLTSDGSGTWVEFASGTSSVTDGVLGTFDPTLLLNGLYELRLRVIDAAGRMVTQGPISVVVDGGMKLGHFSVAFQDLSIAAGGLPLEIVRSYDSRDTSVGDFGPGWRIALNGIRVQKSRNLGDDWQQSKSGHSLGVVYSVEPTQTHLVTVRFPDGETHRFEAGVYVPRSGGPVLPDNYQWLVPIEEARLVFKPMGETTSTLAVEGDNTVYLTGFLGEDFLTQGMAGIDESFNPTRFRLTTKDGSVFLLDEKLGLLEMHDPSGNQVALQRDSQNRVSAIVSTQSLSAAQGGAIARTVTIHRDSAGRVDYIEDLAGRQLDYFYDSQGRLSSFADREGNITTFLYENAKFPYYLTKILDPLGRAALRCEFDDAGRLIKQIDAKGNETVFARGLDATGSFQKVQDRLGHETTYYYDDRGNVTLKLDAEGAATSYTYYPDSDRAKFETDHYGNTKSFAYDAKGNVTVETVGASLSDDPANPTTGYTTRTTYDSHGSPLSMVDPDGRATTFSYDANGNLLTYTAGADLSAPTVGQKTSYTYYDDGSIDTITDALGNTTRHVTEYGISDARFPGAVRRQTVTVTDVARGVLRTTHTYFDEQGNQLAQLATRTLPDATTEDVITRYRYDADNRLVATIQPDGRVSKTRYNAVGKEVKTLEWRTVADYTSADESLARVTSYAYDEAGNLTSTTYADGSTEATGYDAEAHRTWSQDRLGHRTFYLYDKVGRLRFTLLPDDNDGVGASAPTSATDPRLQDNPRTETVYDLAGRALKQIDEAGRVTETRYYADGTPDAGRREKVILGSGTSLAATTTYQYNASGAVRFVTDPRGNTTETQYDNQGRVRYVIYPATDEHPATRTETQYDPLGRRSAVIDQEGNTTRYRYDALGRLLEVRQYLDKSLAAGDADFHLAASTTGVVSTRHAYDELGRQVTQTDALGRATTYWTDSLGRRTRRLLPKEATESTALTEQLDYDAWGYLAHRTDFAGKTTTYAYDTLGRLKSRTADATHPSLAYSHAIARVEYDYDASGARTAARTYSAGSTLLYAEATPRTERGAVDYKQTALGTLDYTYAATGQLEDVVSSNAHGVNIGYRYDALGRLQYVDDGSTGALRTHGYTYNANGSLETVTYATGLTHRYAYDALNRLRTLSVGYGTTTLHGYEYKLRASGHRHQIVEATGRTATYGYDALYRLTGETIAGDPAGQNGTVTYGLDSVGNRLTRTSSVPAVASAANTFNARDWLASDTYDANGNTTAGLNALGERSTTDIYDFENRLILRLKSDGTQLSLSYDADGNRIQKTRFDVSAQPVSTTSYLVDTNNATGYAQVVEERTFEISNPASQITKVYTYGADLISRSEISDAQIANTLYYLYDGLGSVRALSDESGTLTDTYSYDAFGNLIARTGSTDNAYLYRGEQWDADLGLYYNRARYLNPDSGRFWSMDSYEGSPSDPASLHKYLYANANPIAYDDPSGNFSFGEMGSVLDSIGSLARMVVPSVIQRFGTTIAFNIFRASFVAEKALLWLDIGTAIVGGTLFVADSVDRMAENLLNNSNSINDGPFPQSAGRGSQIERIANPNLGGNVNIIDDLDGGVGTSIRSHGLGGDERAYLNAIHADVREVESAPTSRIFGTSKDGRYVNFPAGTVKQPALLVGVPQNHARMLLSPTFRSALENYRAAYGVVVRVVPVRGWIKR